MKKNMLALLLLLLPACGGGYVVVEDLGPADPLVVETSTAPTQGPCEIACARSCLVEVQVDGHLERYVDDECQADCEMEHCS